MFSTIFVCATVSVVAISWLIGYRTGRNVQRKKFETEEFNYKFLIGEANILIHSQQASLRELVRRIHKLIEEKECQSKNQEQ